MTSHLSFLFMSHQKWQTFHLRIWCGKDRSHIYSTTAAQEHFSSSQINTCDNHLTCGWKSPAGSFSIVPRRNWVDGAGRTHLSYFTLPGCFGVGWGGDTPSFAQHMLSVEQGADSGCAGMDFARRALCAAVAPPLRLTGRFYAQWHTELGLRTSSRADWLCEARCELHRRRHGLSLFQTLLDSAAAGVSLQPHASPALAPPAAPVVGPRHTHRRVISETASGGCIWNMWSHEASFPLLQTPGICVPKLVSCALLPQTRERTPTV